MKLPAEEDQSTKPQKKTLRRMFGFDSKDVFFGVPWFFVFLFWKSKNKNLGVFSFLRYWLIVHRPKKTKKLKVFLFFGFYCFGFMWIEKLKTKKNIEFFAVWGLVNSTFMKKTPMFFVFWLSKPQKKTKKTQGTPKKQSFESKPNILLKVWVFLFLFFWFCALIFLSWQLRYGLYIYICGYICM